MHNSYQLFKLLQKKQTASIHTAGWCTKNRYVDIFIHVDSLRLLAATPPTGIVAQLVVRWVALLRFWGLGLNSGMVNFFYFISFFCVL